MDDIKVETGVPLPTNRRKYPFDKMVPNVSSFAVSPTEEQVEAYGMAGAMSRLRSSLTSSAAAYARRREGIKMIVRKDPDEENTLRCWMMSDEDVDESQMELPLEGQAGDSDEGEHSESEAAVEHDEGEEAEESVEEAAEDDGEPDAGDSESGRLDSVLDAWVDGEDSENPEEEGEMTEEGENYG